VAALVLAGLYAATGVATALVARRKGRSPAWWFLGGLVGGIPVLILVALASRGGEPWRFRGPLAVLVFGVAYVGFFVLLAVVAELVG
jgi:hypothetical protein